MNLNTFCELVRDSNIDGLPEHEPGLPSTELRFMLEYASPPDPTQAAAVLGAVFPVHAWRLEALSSNRATACFLILRFPGFERVFRQADLFALAYELADRLGLVSVEPDLGTDFFTEPETQELPTHENAFVRAYCQVTDDPPPDREWALTMVGAQAAWALSTGHTVRIGHADTGYTQHVELVQAIDRDAAVDLIDPAGRGIDPLQAGTANPGHGTATGSVIASRRSGRITGVAPDATLVPIRCIDDVKVFNQAPVAAAIAYAQSRDCQVITMSLGGVPSRALYAAISAAVDANIIVVAAAGNCVTTVVWPARYEEVIAVAGCNYKAQPWIGSCQGTAVDITAPAENVWCARSEADQAVSDAIKAGQGTSYAVAMVAGAAALWLDAHGRDDIAAEAARRDVPVQSLFKAALQATAQQPAEWDGDRFGRGILDALALLRLPLRDIPVILRRESVPDPTRDLRGMLADENVALPIAPRFDWTRYGCELATIALQTAKEGATLTQLRRESKTPGTLPSPQLANAIDGANEPAMSKFGVARSGGITIVRTLAPEAAPFPMARLRHALSITDKSGLEAAGGRFDPRAAQAYLQQGGVTEQLQRLEKKLARLTLTADTRAHAIMAAEHALERAASGAPLGDASARFGFETLVALTGRPALRTVADKVNLNDPRIEDWYDRLYQPVMNWNLDGRVQSVGRIDLDGRHVGTGFVIAPGCILTNRHVLQDIATPIPSRNAPHSWLFDSGQPTIDFADDPATGGGRRRFVIRSVVAAGTSHIGDSAMDFSLLDAAILEVETRNHAGTDLPPALGLWSNQEVPSRYQTIVAIGYPAELTRLPKTLTGEIDDAGLARLDELYGKYNVRYISPGEITVRQDGQRGSRDFWTLRHDATTLGGCSGSCVLQLDQRTGVVGLHFGGTWRTENFGHAIGAVKAFGELFGAANNISWIN